MCMGVDDKWLSDESEAGAVRVVRESVRVVTPGAIRAPVALYNAFAHHGDQRRLKA